MKLITIKYKNSNEFTTEWARKSMALFVAAMIDPQTAKSDHFPYPPMIGDDYYWVLEGGNNWTLRFNRKDASEMTIIHRNGNVGLKALASWVAFRSCGVVSEATDALSDKIVDRMAMAEYAEDVPVRYIRMMAAEIKDWREKAKNDG